MSFNLKEVLVVIDLSQYILSTTYIILKNFIIEDVFIILVNRKSSLGFKIMQTTVFDEFISIWSLNQQKESSVYYLYSMLQHVAASLLKASEARLVFMKRG